MAPELSNSVKDRSVAGVVWKGEFRRSFARFQHIFFPPAQHPSLSFAPVCAILWQNEALLLVFFALFGGVAQLGERRVRNAKVEGSIPFSSTIKRGRKSDSGLYFLPR